MDGLFSDFAALAQVILIDLALAGDNAIAVGLAATALPAHQQRRAIMIGIGLALLLRIIFALFTVQLLQIQGLLFVGGLVLLWVGWRMWRDIAGHTSLEEGLERADAAAAAHPQAHGGATAAETKPASFSRALTSIVLADVTMSLDNVLAVAGVSRHAPEIMAFGLVLSVVLMGVAASFVAGIINRYRWIAYLGVVVIVFAAIRMIWEDGHHLWPAFFPPMPGFLGGHAPPAP